MTTPINLNKARKAKARAEKTQKASENRAKFGRTKSERQMAEARAEKLARLTEGHRLEPGPDDQG
ncbi:DUF4169 family protein [Hyphomonas johnsonii]|uniref:Uncharacterized protein n=1 Tax=Hyphomonas johnsonii MHS-2 TaxID=1280950 RepID=A0A059FQF6_9PROT|nr:DUF4169 family protein [Hyphomonas johnsonii]KCZ92847.1 hypothetical protein HJO_07827 [Hyphomonas johnsonii MHS-2]